MTLGGGVVRLDTRTPLDARIAAVAAAQHGPIAVGQLRACGLSDSAARSRAASGRLHRLYRGVYVPGHRLLPPLGAVAAAVLACGPGAAISHRTAAWLHDLRPDRRRTIDVTVAARTGRRHRWIVTHSAKGLRPQDLTVVGGIPVTAVERTVLDCAPVVGRRGTEKLCGEGERRRVLDLRAVRSLLDHVSRHPGAARLMAALDDLAGARGMTASGPEDALLAAFRAAGLPEPECNSPIQRPDGTWAYADFLWRSQRLIAESDSREYHDRTQSYRSDRRRDRALLQQGYETVRFSDADAADPVACAAEVGAFLARHGG